MAFKVAFYSRKVRDEILGWPSGIAASFVVIAARMVEHGPNLGMQHTRAMADGLFLGVGDAALVALATACRDKRGLPKPEVAYLADLVEIERAAGAEPIFMVPAGGDEYTSGWLRQAEAVVVVREEAGRPRRVVLPDHVGEPLPAWNDDLVVRVEEAGPHAARHGVALHVEDNKLVRVRIAERAKEDVFFLLRARP